MEEHDLDKILENCCDQSYQILHGLYGCVRGRSCEYVLSKEGHYDICALKSYDNVVKHYINARGYEYKNSNKV